MPFITASLSGAGGILVGFAGLNTLIYEPLTASTRILGKPLTSQISAYRNDALTGGLRAGTEFNALLLHRNGPYWWPTWKQARAAENPIMRYERKNNILTAYEKGGKFSRQIPFPQNDDAVPLKFLPSFHSLTDRLIGQEVPTASVTEPPVTFKYKPIDTTLRDPCLFQSSCNFEI